MSSQDDDADPTDDVLLELGRMTYRAIYLESIIDMLCRWIIGPGGQVDKRPKSEQIAEAQSIIKERPDIPNRDGLATWLAEASRAVDRRNAVLHAEIVVAWGPQGPVPTAPGDSWLLHIPRKKGEPSTTTPLTVDGLRSIHLPMEALLARWLDVSEGLGAWRLEMNRRRRLGDTDGQV